MKNLTFLFLIALAFIIQPSASAVDFKTEVRPILQKHCFKCHGGPRPKGKLAFDNADRLAKRIGTDEDAAIVPGKPMDSLMIKKASLPRTDTDAMPPPNRGDALNIAQLTIIKKWIEEGASLEEGGAAPTETTATEGTMSKADPDKLYDWSNSAGAELKAKFVRLEGTGVVLAKEDGTQFTYPLDKLSAESQAQAKELSGG